MATGSSRSSKSEAPAVETAPEETDAPAVETQTTEVAEAPAVEPALAAEAAPVDPAPAVPAGRVAIKLAHPISNEEHMRRLRLDVKPGGYKVNDEVYVTRDDARALINAGLAQVDPEDHEAVRAAIRGA